jgi:hypothetical protein
MIEYLGSELIPLTLYNTKDLDVWPDILIKRIGVSVPVAFIAGSYVD